MAVTPADPLATRTFYAITVTVTTKTDLNTLVAAAYLARTASQIIPPLVATELRIFCFAANTKNIILTDAGGSTTDIGMSYDPGANDKFGTATRTQLPLSNMFFASTDGSSQSMGVVVVV